MEDQKLLWIIFSAVLFVVVVLASALYFLRPKPQELAMASAPTSASFDMYEYFRGPSGPLPLEEREQTESRQIVVGEVPEAAETAEGAPSGTQPPATSPAAGTIQVAPPPQVRVQVSPAAQARTTPASQARTAAPAAAKPAVQPAASVPVTPPTLYWIQTASYKNRDNAEALSEGLAAEGVPGRVQVRDVAGETFYRVRVGPFESKQEAQKFLDWIKGLKGLEQSYISMVYTRAQ